jgi:hypothetical protein
VLPINTTAGIESLYPVFGKGACHGASTFHAGKVAGIGQNRRVTAALPEEATQRKLTSVTFTLDRPTSAYGVRKATLRVTNVGVLSKKVSFIDIAMI